MPPTFMIEKMTKKHHKSPIDMALAKKIVQGALLVLNIGANFNFHSNQTTVLKTMPIGTIANHHHALIEGGVSHRTKSSYENEVKCSWMASNDIQCCAEKENYAPFE